MNSRNIYYFSLAIGSFFIIIGSVILIFDIFVYHGFLVGDLVNVTRGEIKYVGSYVFIYGKTSGWVTVEYRLTTTKSYGLSIIPTKVGDMIDANYPFEDIKFKFEIIVLNQSYVVLKRLA